MRGIILAGGTGSRLHPITLAVSKQLVPVYDKPMIYYPLSTLMLAGIREVLVITTPHEAEQFGRLLGDGSQFGVAITYAVQPSPDGLAQAFLIGEEHIGDERVALVLGDNIFYGPGWARSCGGSATSTAAAVFGYRVADPTAYGVVEFDERGPGHLARGEAGEPRSNYAVPGLYFYGPTWSSIARGLTPSARGELEITDLNRRYLEQGRLHVEVLPRGRRGSTPGPSSRSSRPATSSARSRSGKGSRSAAPEEVAWRMGFLDDEALRARAERSRKSGYGDYLLDLLAARSDSGRLRDDSTHRRRRCGSSAGS